MPSLQAAIAASKHQPFWWSSNPQIRAQPSDALDAGPRRFPAGVGFSGFSLCGAQRFVEKKSPHQPGSIVSGYCKYSNCNQQIDRSGRTSCLVSACIVHPLPDFLILTQLSLDSFKTYGGWTVAKIGSKRAASVLLH